MSDAPVNGTLSLSLGDPQGSILGLPFFCLYINNLPFVCEDAYIIMYADDTVLYTHGKSAIEVSRKIPKVMNKVSDWSYKSRCTVNLEKTLTAFFNNRCKHIRRLLTVRKIKLEFNRIEFKYFEVTLDLTLGFTAERFERRATAGKN